VEDKEELWRRKRKGEGERGRVEDKDDGWRKIERVEDKQEGGRIKRNGGG
jgi:hypothetical protein